ncbi:MAG: aldolase, partial [Deltaproteobacteria bacterium]|nr:aldolase [Deltaproteobacteria bacterium]
NAETFQTYIRWSNENSIVILQVEGMEGVDNIDAILAYPGVDILFLGPYDLSQSLAMPGRIDDPAVIEKMERVVLKAAQKGIVVGTFADTPDRAQKWIDLGVKYIALGCDTKFLLDGARAIISALK